MTKVEKPAWLKLKELHDAEMIADPHGNMTRPRSRGHMYGPEESLVDQVGDGFTNVNDIMKRFEKMPTLAQLQAAGIGGDGGFYADFIGAPDYEQALQISNRAKDQFALLPAHVRGRFENDPAKFLDFVSREENGAECIRMGLKKEPEPKKEPEVSLKDVRDAIKAGQGTKKTATKGGEGEE
jgi:phage internal scaffolding protein